MTLAADLLIAGGMLVDGTGAPGRPGRMAVTGGRLALPPDDVDIVATRTIDATGLVVAPGFIDLHSHGGLVMLAEPRHEPKVRQGVTTELIGVDGNAYAPFPSRNDLLDFAVLNGGLDGRPDIAFDWSTVAEYLARYDGAASVNVAYIVGNSPLRIAAIGWDEVAADERTLADQRAARDEQVGREGHPGGPSRRRPRTHAPRTMSGCGRNARRDMTSAGSSESIPGTGATSRGSTAIMSASLPGSSEPIESCCPSARAPSYVASRSQSSGWSGATSSPASPRSSARTRSPFWMYAPARMFAKIESSGPAATSEPRPTRIPAAR